MPKTPWDGILPSYVKGQYLILIGTIIVLIIYFLVSSYLHTEIGIIIAIIALIITLSIAITQQLQLNKLERIGEQTKATTDKLGSDWIIRDRVDKFFVLKGDRGQKFQIFFPVIYKSKPLPMMNQGDFFAVHVLGSRLGENNIENHPVSNSDLSLVEPGSRTIFICRPDMNPVLRSLIDTKKITDGWPAWFIEEGVEKVSGKDWTIRKIRISDKNERIEDTIPSPSDDIYKKALNCAEGKKFSDESKKIQDIGIFARIHEEDRQIIIIAGIHQYGTWIIGGLLSRLFYGKPVKGEEIFLDDKDFISVIWGEFDSTQLIVSRFGIHNDYIWTRKDNTWIRKRCGDVKE